jgi:hypothetical protein
MTSLKITQLTETTTPVLTDIIPIVTDPSGSPANKKVTIANLLSLNNYSPFATVFSYEGLVTSGSCELSASLSVATTLTFTFYTVTQGSTANGDELTFTRLLKAGTYTFVVYGFSANNRGKLDWYMDGSTFITGQEWYTAVGGLQTRNLEGMVIVGDGLHTIKCKVNGKHASSSNYVIALSYFSLLRTGS